MLHVLTEARNDPQIVATVYLSEGAVKENGSGMLDTFGMHDRTSAALYAVLHG